jgi:hypothetical protein
MMPGNLEFIMSSLPYLSFPPSQEELARIARVLYQYDNTGQRDKSLVEILEEEAGRYLNKEQQRLFNAITLANLHREEFRDSANKTLSKYARFTFDLKDRIRHLRSLRKGRPQQESKILPLPLEPGDPLREEIRLMSLQWEELERHTIGHYADFSALVSYKIKLQILERYWQFNPQRGMEIFRSITKRAADGR